MRAFVLLIEVFLLQMEDSKRWRGKLPSQHEYVIQVVVKHQPICSSNGNFVVGTMSVTEQGYYQQIVQVWPQFASSLLKYKLFECPSSHRSSNKFHLGLPVGWYKIALVLTCPCWLVNSKHNKIHLLNCNNYFVK